MTRFVYLLSLASLFACSEIPVGRQCFISADAAPPNQTVVSSPALECQSRTCLHLANQSPDLCTGECSTNEDCVADDTTTCEGGFVCTVPVVVGAFCCKKMCVCSDYLTIPDGGMPATPAQCDPTNTANECCNLEGRRGDPDYPQCS
jgi:hypothetical protein